MQFYYHPDHLGSSSYITNLDGEVSQHIEYVPFGEVFIEERNNTWNTPYLFNAKDLDEETGMYYYDGARYYAPRLNLWMSTDPLQEKYHNISSYCYTFNNTIKFIDPNGQDGWDKVKGFGDALLDNATGGLINLRSYAGRHVSNPTDFNRGLAAGDAASVGIGTGKAVLVLE
jgi:RHS repeat-associated core domain protein